MSDNSYGSKSRFVSLPYILIFSRLFFAFIAIVAFYMDSLRHFFGVIVIALMFAGIITDILDGILARKMGVSTIEFRKLDSNVDQVFWLVCFTLIVLYRYEFFHNHMYLVAGVLMLELICYFISFYRWRKTVATHSLLAKVWTISLLIFLADISWYGNSIAAFYICLILGIVSRLEIIAMLLTLQQYHTDIPTFFQVKKLNQGKEIKRNRWFNG